MSRTPAVGGAEAGQGDAQLAAPRQRPGPGVLEALRRGRAGSRCASAAWQSGASDAGAERAGRRARGRSPRRDRSRARAEARRARRLSVLPRCCIGERARSFQDPGEFSRRLQTTVSRLWNPAAARLDTAPLRSLGADRKPVSQAWTRTRERSIRLIGWTDVGPAGSREPRDSGSHFCSS